jgi:6-pyruvoyltetrahydropterin/6-carboxytetrahydropterin synthase
MSPGGVMGDFFVTRTVEFDSGHRVPYHDSKCRNPHGHRYKVEASISGPLVTATTSDHGMVVDFGALKALLQQEVADRWDHAMLVWDKDRELRDALEGHSWRVITLPLVPTAENLAYLAFLELDPWVTKAWDGRVRLRLVRVWETPNCVAAYIP